MKSLKHPFWSLSLFLAAIAGCDAKQANAPRVPVVVPQGHTLRTYPREDIHFQKAQILMWREDMNEYTIARVLENAAQYDDLQDELFLMNKSRRELTGLKDLLDAAGLSDSLSLTPLDDQLNEHVENKSKLSSDREKLEQLRTQPASEENEKAIKKLEKSISKLENKVRPLEGFLAQVSAAGLNAELDAWRGLDVRFPLVRGQAGQFVDAIEKDAWRNGSKSIHFSFSFHRDRSVHARIENWDLTQSGDSHLIEEGAPTEYSSEARTIGNVTFQPLGGAFTFEVYTPAAVYWFKIAGNKYDAKDGRIHYKGDIVRCAVENGYGRPVIVHVRDFVQCGVDSSGLILDPNDSEQKVGTPVLRRGVANLVDQEDGE